MEKLDPHQISLSNVEDEQLTTTLSIKKEIYEEVYVSPINYSYDDISEVKQEEFSDDYNASSCSMDSHVEVDTKIEIKNELYNNLLHTSNLEQSSTENQELQEYRNITQKDNIEVTTGKRRNRRKNTTHLPSNPYIASPPKRRREKRACCDVCEKTLSNSYALLRHRRIHTGEEPYECDQCSKAYMTLSNLVDHKHSHTGEKCHVCDQCGKAYTTSFALMGHKRAHTGSKRYTCKICSNFFKRLPTFENHKRIHINGKQNVGRVCKKTLNVYSNMLRPQPVLKSETLSFTCDVCCKVYNCLNNLKSHERIHTDGKEYACDICGITLTTLSALMCHKHIHKGEQS